MRRRSCFPLMNKKHFVGAPLRSDRRARRSLRRHAGVRQGGADRRRGGRAPHRVVDLRRAPDGSWDVITEQGNVHAEHVVNAGGLWAREVGRMVGLELPILAMEHQYLITEDLPQLKGQKEQLHCIDFEGEIYTRQERGGMLLGTYERAGVPWSPRADALGLRARACCRMTSSASRRAWRWASSTFRHSARSASARWSTVRSPSRPTAIRWWARSAGCRNFWVACGVMAGFSQGGGVGLALAQWMVEGDPGADVWAMDVARYGDWATLAYTNAKVRENYSRRFRIRFPNEELPAARPLRTTPVYERLAAQHAVFGDYCGLEHPLWFAPERRGGDRRTSPSTAPTRTPTWAPSARRCARAWACWRSPTTASSRSPGPGTEEWLSYVMANRVPQVGPHRAHADAERARQAHRRLHHVPAVGASACFSSAPMPPRSTTGAGSSATRRRPASRVRPCAMEYVGLSVAGPRSRALLQTPGARGPLQRGLPVPVVPADGRRHGARACRPHQLHRRTRLRDLGRRASTSARSTSCCRPRGASAA